MAVDYKVPMAKSWDLDFDDDDSEQHVDVRFRAPYSLREQVKAVALVQTEMRKLAKKRAANVSANKVLTSVLQAFLAFYRRRNGPLPVLPEDEDDFTEKDRAAVKAYAAAAHARKTAKKK